MLTYAVFHHDGPFDACMPNRNRKGLRSTPMEAFPEDSANNTIGGSGPIKSKMDVDLYNGYTVEAHNDFSATGADPRKNEDPFWDAKARDVVHGQQTPGLGTSTHLDGTPASSAAIRERRESEAENRPQNTSGLQRKKSIAQKLRGIGNRDSGSRTSSGEYPRGSTSSGSRHVGGVPGGRSPFFQEEEEDNELERIRAAKARQAQRAEGLRPPTLGISRSRSVSTPKAFDMGNRSNERSKTLEDGKPSTGGGLISRMKSLRKPKPERRMSDD